MTSLISYGHITIGQFLQRIRPLALQLRRELRDFLGCSPQAERLSMNLIRNVVTWCSDDTVEVERMAQMDTETIQVNETTTFVESSAIERTTVPTFEPTIHQIDDYTNIMNFLKRDVMVAKYTWSSSKVLWDSLGVVELPKGLLNGTEHLNKCNGFYLFRPDLEITIRLTTTDMHYGKLMVSVLPIPYALPNTFTHPRSASGGEWYQINASTTQPVVFKLPYRNFEDYIPLVEPSTSVFRTLYSLNFIVTSPLSFLNGTSTSITIEVFAKFLDAKLTGATNRPALAQMDSQESLDKSKQGMTVSKGLDIVADFVTIFDKIPVLGSFTKPASDTIRRSALMLKKHGYSVPVNAAVTQNVQVRGPLLNKAEDLVNSVVLGPSQTMAVSKDHNLVCDEIGCTDILGIIQRPFLTYVGKVSSSNAVGDELFKLPLKPTNIIALDYVNTAITDDHIYTSHLALISSLFSMWRGGFRVMISFECSSYHSMKAIAYWQPSNTGNYSVPVGETYKVYSVFMDVTKSKEYTFTIPYMQANAWQPISEADMSGTMDTNGTLFIVVDTVLTSPTSVVNPIYFHVYISAAADFQLALPDTNNVEEIGRIRTAQMDVPKGVFSSSSHLEIKKCKYPIIGGTESGVVFENKNTAFVVKDLRQLMNMLTPVRALPDEGNFRFLPAVDCAMATITFRPFGKFNFDAAGTSVFSSMMYRGNLFNVIRSLFLFQRGSVRLVIHADVSDPKVSILHYKPVVYNWGSGAVMSEIEGGFQMTAAVSYNPGVPDPVNQLFTIPNDVANGVTNSFFRTRGDPIAVSFGTGTAIFNHVGFNTLDINVPYYSGFNCNLLNFNQNGNNCDTPVVQITAPAYLKRTIYDIYSEGVPTGSVPEESKVYQYTMSSAMTTIGAQNRSLHITNPVRYLIYLAAGDDFIVGCLLPPPIVRRGASAARRRRSVSVEDVLMETDHPEPQDPMRLRRGIQMFNPVPKKLSKSQFRNLNLEQVEHYNQVVAGAIKMPREWASVLMTPAEMEAYYLEG